MLEKPTKIKKIERGGRERKKFEISKRTEFYKLFEVEMLNNSLDVTSGSEAVWGNTTDFSSFFLLSIKVCHKPEYTQCKCNILSKKNPSHSSNCE